MNYREIAIEGLRPEFVDTVSALIESVIAPLDYYSTWARSAEIEKYNPTRLTRIIAEDPRSVIIALHDGFPAGFCINNYDDGLVWLAWFGVTPEYRGKGIAQALLAALFESATNRGCHKVWCDTRTTNLQSQAVLSKAGFTKICELRRHWYREDFILWERQLDA